MFGWEGGSRARSRPTPPHGPPHLRGEEDGEGAARPALEAVEQGERAHGGAEGHGEGEGGAAGAGGGGRGAPRRANHDPGDDVREEEEEHRIGGVDGVVPEAVRVIGVVADRAYPAQAECGDEPQTKEELGRPQIWKKKGDDN